MMFALQQAPAPTGGFVVKIIQPPSDVEGLADVLIGSLGLIRVAVLGAVLLTQCRYESVLFVGPVALVIVASFFVDEPMRRAMEKNINQRLKGYTARIQDLDFNMMMSNLGHFTLAHTDSSVRVQRERAETNKILGVDSRLIFRDEIAELCPELNMSMDVPYPIEAALYHPPGSVLRHDAVVWGYATGAYHRGVELHQGVEVTGFEDLPQAGDASQVVEDELRRGRRDAVP